MEQEQSLAIVCCLDGPSQLGPNTLAQGPSPQTPLQSQILENQKNQKNQRSGNYEALIVAGSLFFFVFLVVLVFQDLGLEGSLRAWALG